MMGRIRVGRRELKEEGRGNVSGDEDGRECLSLVRPVMRDSRNM